MSESQLPPVYMPKEHKRIRIDPLHGMMFLFCFLLEKKI